MTTPQFLTFLLAILAHTAALVWWAASLNTTVKFHDQTLLDHEERLREAKL